MFVVNLFIRTFLTYLLIVIEYSYNYRVIIKKIDILIDLLTEYLNFDSIASDFMSSL